MLARELTIAIPTRNAAKTLGITLGFLQPLRQAGACVILADSFSEDGTVEIAKSSVDKILDVPKGNMYRAVNAALMSAKTEWLTYVNGDDLLFAPPILDALGAAAAEDDILYGDLDFMDEKGCFLHSWTSPPASRLWPLFSGPFMPIPQPGTLFRRHVFEELRGFDERFRYSADYDFFLRAASRRFKFAKHSSRLASFRIHNQQISNLHASNMVEECQLAVSQIPGRVSRIHYMFSLLLLRILNWHSYAIRFLRAYQLSGKFRITKTIQVLRN